MRSLQALLLILLSGSTQAAGPDKNRNFSAQHLPTHGQIITVLDESLSITSNQQKIALQKFDGFTEYKNSYVPTFYYIAKDQKMNFPGFVVAPLVQTVDSDRGVTYSFKAHDSYPNVEKDGRMEILVANDGSCQMTWAFKNYRSGEIQDQANGAVRYACGKGTESLSATH